MSGPSNGRESDPGQSDSFRTRSEAPSDRVPPLPADAAPDLHLPSTDADSGRPAAGPPPLPAVPGYEVLGELGRGGMGVVYQARHLGLGRPVALKMVLAGAYAGPDELQRFRAEAEVAARLQHPNLVTVHEVGSYQGQPYFTLEYMGGGSLARCLAGQPLPPREAAALVAELAAGIAYAHGQGVIHRDLKPANILLRRRPGEPQPQAEAGEAGFRVAEYEVKIADFGLAKRVDPGTALTASGAVLGTPSYMAPEQAAGKTREIGPAADVFALGAILYECLTGRPPFRAATALDTLLQVLTAEPVPVRQLQPGVPRDLETVCLKCLEKQPHRRYGSAAELTGDLRRFLAGQPVRARPVRLPGRLLKWVNRQPVVAGLAGAVVAAVLAGRGVSAWGWLTAEQARRDEATQRGKAERAEGRALKLANDEAVARAGEARQREAAVARLYASNIPLAERELRLGRQPHALELLNECPAALRHWEWRYLKRQLDAGQQTLVGPPSLITGVAFSPDGKHLAVVNSTSGDVRIWDVAAGTEVRRLPGNGGQVGGAAWMPDSKQIVLVSQDGTVRFWDAGTGALSRTLNTPAGAGLLALSRDGKRLALADTRRLVTVWEVATGKEALALPAQPAKVTAVAFSPDGARLAVGRQMEQSTLGQPTAAVWEVTTGKQTVAFAAQHTSALGLAFSHDGGRLAVGSQDNCVRVFDLRNGLLTPGGVLTGPRQAVSAVAFSPDGRRLAAGSRDHLVRVWELEAAQEPLTLGGHDEVVGAVAFSPDGRHLASGGWEGVAKVWDLAAGQGPSYLVASPTNTPCTGVAFSRDGTQVLSAGLDRTARLWDLTTRRVKVSFPGLGSAPRAVALSPDGRFAAAADAGGAVKLWDSAGRERFTFQAEKEPRAGGTGPKAALAFSRDGGRLTWADAAGAAAAWDTATGRELLRRPGSSPSGWTVALGDDGQRLAWVTRGGAIRVRDPAAREDRLTLYPRTAMFPGLAFDPTGRYLASADKQLWLWDLATGRQVLAFGGRGSSAGQWLAFSPDGRRLASASYREQTLLIWEVPSGRELLSLPGRGGPVRGLGFSPDGRYLAVAGDQGLKVFDAPPAVECVRHRDLDLIPGVAVSPDGSLVASTDGPAVNVWERASGRPVLLLPWQPPGAGPDPPTDDLPFTTAFSPDGTRLAVGGGGETGRVELWDVATGRLVHTLPGHRAMVWALAFSPDGTRLASASHDKTAKIWNVVTGKELFALKGHTDRVSAVAFAPDGRRLATGSHDRKVKLWDPATGREFGMLPGHTDTVAAVAFRPDGLRLAAATVPGKPSATGEVAVWDLAAGSKVRSLRPDSGGLFTVAFSPDGRLLAAAGVDRVIHLWDEKTGRKVFALRGHEATVLGLAFTGDGRFLVSCGRDRTVRVWDLDGLPR
jgi:WD40 repeat protein